MKNLVTVFATKRDGAITDLELARREFGPDVVTGFQTKGIAWPYGKDYEIVGYVRMHRTGPSICVLRKKAAYQTTKGNK